MLVLYSVISHMHRLVFYKMARIHTVSYWLMIACSILYRVDSCADLDPHTCQHLTTQNPNYCHESTLIARTVCPKHCGHCALTCYHCETVLHDVAECNQTKQCQPGEVCDGVGSISVGKRRRRDINAECCSDDLCNQPAPTTTPPVTGTTSKYHNCRKDVEIMIEKSVSRTNTETADIVHLVKTIVTNLNIGINENLIGLALFDSEIDQRLRFNDTTNQQSLLKAINNIQINATSDWIDYTDVIAFLKEALTSRRGDRAGYSDVVMIFVDHSDRAILWGGSAGAAASASWAELASLTHKKVIVVNMGSHPLADKFAQLATDAEHILSVQHYSDLFYLTTALLDMICH